MGFQTLAPNEAIARYCFLQQECEHSKIFFCGMVTDDHKERKTYELDRKTESLKLVNVDDCY